MKTFFLFVFAMLFCGQAFAGVDDAGFWQGIADKIPVGEGALLMIAGGVLDVLLRVFKTERPVSILRGVAVALAGLAKVADKAANLLDKILGNRAALPAEPVVPPKA